MSGLVCGLSERKAINQDLILDMSSSPLQLFGQAKKKINQIFVNVTSYIEESSLFLSEIACQDNIVSNSDVQKVSSFKEKVSGICDVLARNHMKVAFFGRTSNGKSTTINAMLRKKILPSGIGHTTNCFIQVEGSDTSDGYILTDDSQIRKPLQTVGELAHALSHTKVKENTLIRIVWPKDKCNLLSEDVILVDSPGIDVSPNLDSWIDNFCLDADVFVLVANAESTLMQTEKNFFLKVNDRLSKPNVFILNNRWDASASEPEMMEEVRQQHLERNVSFLTDELKVYNAQEAAKRVFFVSARETLVSRLKDDVGTPTPTGSLQEGYESRLFEFATFEKKFEETLSQSAVRTKFAPHTDRAKTISRQIQTILDAVHTSALRKKQECLTSKKATLDKIDYIEKQLELLTHEIKDNIKQMVDDVHNNVTKALNEEIRRLPTLIDEFERPFHPDPSVLQVYRKDLHVYVEEGLNRRVQGRCSANFNSEVEATEREMTERLSVLLAEDTRQQMVNLLPKRDFEIAYRMNVKHLCSEFQEDIQFRFSLGITVLMNRFLTPQRAQSLRSGMADSIPRGVPMTETEFQPPTMIPDAEQQLMLSAVKHFASLTSRSTFGAIIVVGIGIKAVGWKVIAVGGAIYGGIYVYERLMWTKKAQERVFKQQYVDYVSGKLRLIVDITSRNCSHQVQQELATTFNRLCSQVERSRCDLEDESKKFNSEAYNLDEIGRKSLELRKKGDNLDIELDSFVDKYLKPGSQSI